MYPRIRELRENRNLTQAQVGKAIGVSQRTYSHYEKGQSMLPLKTLVALAEFHNTSVEYLLGRTDNPEFHSRKR